MIKWIFFDLGNVILNDDPAMIRLYQYIFESLQKHGVEVDISELLAIREKAILEDRNGFHHYAVARHFLTNGYAMKELNTIKNKLASEWESVAPIIPGAVDVLKVSAKLFQLGVLANQPNSVMNILEKYNLYNYFEINAISANAGFSKPDQRLFKYALHAAGCQPEEAVMVGDRIDNDIIPAKSLGMKTIWLRLPLKDKGFMPQTDFEEKYVESIERASASYLEPISQHDEPDYRARSYPELIEIINRIRDF